MEFLSTGEIILGVIGRFTPVWIAVAVVMIASFIFRRNLSLYGRLYDTALGMVGAFLVFFWIFTWIFDSQIATFGALDQFALMRKAPPGAIESGTGVPFYFGADNLGRDVFSRMVYGTEIVLIIAPLATLIAFMVGITLGLPAGYYGGRTDAVLSFLANLVLSFPVILLFYLLVTPGISAPLFPDLAVSPSIPGLMAGTFFAFPIIFLFTLVYSRYSNRPDMLFPLLAVIILVGGWLYSAFVFKYDPIQAFGMEPFLAMEPNELNIFVAVVFASSPGVFRIVRGLTLDIATRDYVAAGQTRGERPWYLMLWEILPNARGPLIVDFCLRIGYTTIALGTLGFFGLGMGPESPDWGSTINQGRRFIMLYVHSTLPPALALMSFVLGLNLLADALREQSLKD